MTADDSPRTTTSAYDKDGRRIYFDDLVRDGETVEVEGRRMIVRFDPQAPDWYLSDAADGSPKAVRPVVPWSLPPEGFYYEAVEQSDWIMPPIGAGRCRYGKPSCKKPAAASLVRSNGPWDYCSDHLYGRWIEDGKVMGWRMVRDA